MLLLLPAVVVLEFLMKLFLKLRLPFLLLSSALVSSASVAGEIFFEDTRSQKSPDSWVVDTKLKSGFGRFNNFQLPVSFDGDVHIDGIVAEGGTTEHSGLVMGFDMQLLSPATTWQWLTAIEASRIENLSLGQFNAEATLQRLGAETGLLWNRALLEDLQLSFTFGLQRNDYESISTAHTVTSLFPKLAGDYQWGPRLSLGGFFLVGLSSEVGYKGSLGRKTLADARASQWQSGAHVGYGIGEDATLVFATTYDATDIDLVNIGTYQNAGLAVTSLDSGATKFALRTFTTSLGFQTRW